MTLGIVFKGPEGLVLAVDSRVTLNTQVTGSNGEQFIIPSTYDNATKLLRVAGQDFVGAITYGLGAIGQKEPRTAHSFIPEFEAELAALANGKRLLVKEFAEYLSAFFMRQWEALDMPEVGQWKMDPMIFLVAGYDPDAAYGCAYEVNIPLKPAPTELSDDGSFGAFWGGQREYIDRLMQGFDPRIPALAIQTLGSPRSKEQALTLAFKKQCTLPIPYQFLPLQDCVDLSIFLIRTTINLQTWTLGIRGVGGHIDVATITKIDGFKSIQGKAIQGERRQ